MKATSNEETKQVLANAVTDFSRSKIPTMSRFGDNGYLAQPWLTPNGTYFRSFSLIFEAGFSLFSNWQSFGRFL